jgi:hypothetical protein
VCGGAAKPRHPATVQSLELPQAKDRDDKEAGILAVPAANDQRSRSVDLRWCRNSKTPLFSFELKDLISCSMIYMSFGSWLQRGGDAAFRRPAITSFDTSGNNQERNLTCVAAIALAHQTKNASTRLATARANRVDAILKARGVERRDEGGDCQLKWNVRPARTVFRLDDKGVIAEP